MHCFHNILLEMSWHSQFLKKIQVDLIAIFSTEWNLNVVSCQIYEYAAYKGRTESGVSFIANTIIIQDSIILKSYQHCSDLSKVTIGSKCMNCMVCELDLNKTVLYINTHNWSISKILQYHIQKCQLYLW